MTKKNYLDVDDFEVYRMLCQLHIDVCDLTHRWPLEEKYELGSQARRASNSAPAQLAEKNDDTNTRAGRSMWIRSLFLKPETLF